MSDLYALSFFAIPLLAFWGLCWASDRWDEWDRRRYREPGPK